ncbi:ABC transporter substrate-binding protein [Maridesulfovibrio bastinii]|uniref:ABC transporter substrate-binding protein n=1 Tax=Maridesulfovibrio bastinii TaxID=47157 RepID=UPI0004057C2B|nr:ABC transporter substrate-binding protein [Maridesulfovibrio bastinii]
MFKKIYSFAVFFALLVSFAGSAFATESHDMLPDNIKSSGKIIVGINGIFPPMEFKKSGSDKLIGFDIDLINALGKELGVQIVLDDQKFDQLINSINTNRVDLVISGLSDSAVRRKTLDFIDYFKTGTQCFTTKKFAQDVPDMQSLSGKTLAVSAATDYLTTMQKWSKNNLESKGKPGIKIMAVDSAATARMQMLQGRAQASALSPEALGWANMQQGNSFVPVGPVLDPNPYGICFSKKNTQLRDAVYAALKVLFENGTYSKIITEWHAEAGALAQPTINSEGLE